MRTKRAVVCVLVTAAAAAPSLTLVEEIGLRKRFMSYDDYIGFGLLLSGISIVSAMVLLGLGAAFVARWYRG